MHTWQHTMGPALMGESGGDYNALFNYSNRAGGPFAGVNVTEMTIDDLLQFSDPDGPYGQYVKSQIGRVSTPMGGFQVVGSTLRMAKQGLGLKGNEKFDEAMQNRIGEYIFKQQGAGAWEALKKGGGIMNFMPQQAQQPMMPQEEKQGFDFRRFAAALDPLIMPEMRAGDALRAQMEEEKTKKRTNQTVAYLRGLGTAQGEQLAAMVEGGQLKSSDAFRALMQLQQSDRDFERQKELALFEAGLKGEKDTALIRNAKAAGLVEGTPEYARFILSNGDIYSQETALLANLPNPEKGMRYEFERAADGSIVNYKLVPIAGSQAEADASAIEGAEQASRSAQAQAGSTVLEDIGRAKEIALNDPFLTTGFVGGILKNVGGTKAKTLNELTSTIKANIGFDRLQRMRDESPTGGALGQVAVQELVALQNSLGSLDQSLDDAELVRNLTRLEAQYKTTQMRLYQAALQDQRNGKINKMTNQVVSPNDYFTQGQINEMLGISSPSSGSQTLSDDDLIKKYGG